MQLNKIINALSWLPVPEDIDETRAHQHLSLYNEVFSTDNDRFKIRVLESSHYEITLCHFNVYTILIAEDLYMTKPFYDFLVEKDEFNSIINYFKICISDGLIIKANEYFEVLKYLQELDTNFPGEGLSQNETDDMIYDFYKFECQTEVYFTKNIFKLSIFSYRCYQRGIEFLARKKELSNLIKQFLFEKHMNYTERSRKTKVFFVSLGNSKNNDVWNILSIESLAGDLIGEYKIEIAIDYVRISTKDSIDEIINRLSHFKPDLIGISVEIGTESLYEELINAIYHKHIQAQIVIGGILPTYIPNYFYEMQLFQKLNIIGSIGEGELCLREIVKLVRGEIEISKINNIYYFDRQYNCVKFTSAKSVPKKLLIYPPTTYTVKEGRTNILQFSRNCIFNCTYCSQGPNKRWQSMPYNRMIKNICLLLKKGVNELEFVDDEFFGGRSEKYQARIRDIILLFKQAKAKYNTSLSFRIFTNPFIVWKSNDSKNNTAISNLLLELKDIGLKRIYLGIESGSEDQRKRYNRTESIEECLRSIELLRNIGIEIDAGFIMFDPEMTIQDIQKNVKFFKDNNLLASNTWPFRPLTVTIGTPIYYKLLQVGLLKKTHENNNLLSVEYIFKNKEVESVFSYVTLMAQTSDILFYNLKYITKEHNNEHNFNERYCLCKKYVIQNAEIFLDFLDQVSVDSYREELCKELYWKSLSKLSILLNDIEEHLNIIALDDPVVISSFNMAKKNLEGVINAKFQ